ncbi:DUF4279 domain-containing protein [Ornithinibacillus sp. 179-J 7C1 HS]|uniref:DUF4279 domain-containing protein n=1 Tax=Ornithinibacillus sp. 179-J 7C1 HS TaxID=3142384 RepID=UPI0039A2117A
MQYPYHKGTMEAQGVTIPYTLSVKNSQPKKIAILLPGKEYTTQGPIMWYTNHLYWDEGFDTFQFHYSGMNINEENLPVIVNEMILSFLQDQEYDTVHFVSLGLGSTIAAYFLTHQLYPNIKAVWFTPYTHHPQVLQALLERPNKGLVVIGEISDVVDDEDIQLLEGNENLTVAHVAGVNDLLEGIYVELNIDAMRSVIQMIREYIKKEQIELNEKKSEIMVYFSLYGDDFPLEEVTEKLGVLPTDTDKKGEEIIPPNGKINPDFRRYYTQTWWELGTDYEASVDLKDKMNEVIQKLRDKVFIINELRKKYDLTSRIQVVIRVENGEMPILTLDKKILSFAHQIQTEYISLDTYVMPFDENLRFESDGITFKGRKL